MTARNGKQPAILRLQRSDLLAGAIRIEPTPHSPRSRYIEPRSLLIATFRRLVWIRSGDSPRCPVEVGGIRIGLFTVHVTDPESGSPHKITISGIAPEIARVGAALGLEAKK